MHARCNLGVHDMNNTILMVWSGGVCSQFCSLIKSNVFVSGCELQIPDQPSLQVNKTNKGNEAMQCNKVSARVSVLNWGYLTKAVP